MVAYPLNTEGLVREESDPALPDPENIADTAGREFDAAGVESAPTLSTEAVEAVERMADRAQAN